MKRLKLLTGFMLVVSVLLACRVSGSSQPGAQARNLIRTLDAGGISRSYLVHIPASYDPFQKTAVVLVFHGGGGNADNARNMTGFDAVADVEGFVVVYPNGTGQTEQFLLTWNGGECCGYAVEQGIDDVGFVVALLDDLETVVAVDPKRIYASGMSNGAIMSFRLACELSDKIAAIGPVAATQNIENCTPDRPVPVLEIHGDSDQNVPYKGGVGADSLVGIDFSSVAETQAFWVGKNGCDSNSESEQVGNIHHEVYSGCEKGAAVELYTVLGGGHAWPGGQPGRQGADVPTAELNASEVIWAFFAAHPMP